MIWKSHHSLADGVSQIALNLQFDETYAIDKLVPFKEIGFLNRCLVRAMFPFYLPIILYESFFRKVYKNPLHDGVRELTGKKSVAISKEFDF